MIDVLERRGRVAVETLASYFVGLFTLLFLVRVAGPSAHRGGFRRPTSGT